MRSGMRGKNLKDKVSNFAKNAIIGALLITVGSLIYILLEQGIGFSDVLDYKTVANVCGTLGGAFLGAYFAGKYSIRAVEKQIEHQEEKDTINNLKTNLQVLKMHETYLNVISGNTDEDAREKLRKNYSKNEAEFFESLYEFIKGVCDDLKKVDISSADIDSHLLLLDSIKYAEACRVEFKNLERFSRAKKEKEFLNSLGNLRYFNGKIYEIFSCIVDEQEKLEKLI